jgi:hypothetical protein
MKFLQSLRRTLAKDVEDTRPTIDFTTRVDREKERLQSAPAGRLDAEIRGLDQRLAAAQDAPDPRDVAELIALSCVFVERFHYRPLQRWSALLTFDEARLVFDSTYHDAHAGYNLSPGEKSWREHLLEFARALHLGELFDDPLRWLIAWRPSEPREHATKIDVLKAADLGTLTTLLLTIADWEIEQYASEKHAAEPDWENAEDLWQGLSDTREMRLAIAEAWCRHPRIPVDYAQAVGHQTAERQIAFLAEKADALTELGRIDALEKTGSAGSVDANAVESSQRFALYS